MARTAGGVAAWLTRPVIASMLLLAVYGGLSLLLDPGGYLGTDTGAKVATLEVMDQRGTARPWLGYWAKDLDPDGTLHPIYDSSRVDGDWVHVTTLPMLELGRPLYALGGYRLTLVLPMLGALATAFAARALARAASSSEDVGWWAFWVVGLASPITVYALDFWEHTPGVACITWAVVLLGDLLVRSSSGARAVRALGAGTLLGTAAAMRTEALVYALVAVGLAMVIVVARERRIDRALGFGAMSVGGFGGAWLLNGLLESIVDGTARSTRAAGAASRGLGDLEVRAREAVVTLLSMRGDEIGHALLVGGLAAGSAALAVGWSRRGRSEAWVLLVIAVLLHLSAIAGGFGFVPGLFSAAPIAVVGAVTWRRDLAVAYPLGIALGSLPLVWAFQYTGGAGPQWAGRYTLTSCVLLVALGVVGLTSLDRVLRIGFIALSVMVTASGVLWLSERSHEVARLFQELVERPEDVVVARNGFFIREGGDAYAQRLWLTAVTPADVERAVQVIGASGLRSFVLLDESPTAPATIGNARLVDTTHTTVVGEDRYLHSYVLPDP